MTSSKLLTTYQHLILVKKSTTIQVRALGSFTFPKGFYIYTGSAKKNMEARIQRHCSKEKKLRWHIDYLLIHLDVQIEKVKRSRADECILNQSIKGKVLVKGFGSSDCTKSCGSHLKYLGDTKKASCLRETGFTLLGIIHIKNTGWIVKTAH